MSKISNSKIITSPAKKGGYCKILTKILFDKRLTDSAKILLQLLLNNSEDWHINLEFYSDKLDWGKDKQAIVVKNLIENGYLKREQKPLGRGKGFIWFYTISEFGNLNPNEEVKTPDEQPADQLQEMPGNEPEKPFTVTTEDFVSYLKEVNNDGTESFKNLMKEKCLRFFTAQKNKTFKTDLELADFVIDAYNKAKGEVMKLKPKTYSLR